MRDSQVARQRPHKPYILGPNPSPATGNGGLAEIPTEGGFTALALSQGENMDKYDGLIALVGLCGAIANGPSNCGNRKDGKICTAQAGECRYNYKYYTPGMNDAKSWSQPCADNTCPERCGYLQAEARKPLPEEKRRELALGLIEGLGRKEQEDRLMGALCLGMMGIDPRDEDGNI